MIPMQFDRSAPEARGIDSAWLVRALEAAQTGARRGVIVKAIRTPGHRRQAALRQRELRALLRTAPQADVPWPVVGRGECVKLRDEQLFHPQHKSFRQQGPHPQFKINILYRISAQKESPQSFQLHLCPRL